MDHKALLKKLEAIRIPLLILAAGLVLLLLPSGKQKEPAAETHPELAGVLSCAEGVGEARVLISEHGVVVVCEGADSAAVKMDIIRAVGSYTGFGADRITILHLTGQ